MKTFSFKSPFKKEIFSSILWNLHPFYATKANRVQMVSHFNCGGKILLIINSFFLCKSLFHNPHLMLIKWSIWFILVFVDPLVANWFCSKWMVHQCPCPIVDERIILLLHSFSPLIMRSKSLKGSWITISQKTQFAIKLRFHVITWIWILYIA